MISVTLRYGSRDLTVSLDHQQTIREIISDSSRRAYLGYPENVSPVINGENVSLDHYVENGDDILLEKQAAAKA